jgi:hypothetical protein
LMGRSCALPTTFSFLPLLGHATTTATRSSITPYLPSVISISTTPTLTLPPTPSSYPFPYTIL